ncbi:MAG: flagellar export protein FliJ [Clostridiales bacterium]|nr:flagellar export protein FliJ [Clostridiales bacterium]
MKKFAYPMQNVLNLKLKMEEQEKNNYSIAKHKLSIEEDKLTSYVQRKQAYEEGLRQEMSSRLILMNVKRFEEAIETMKDMIKTQTQVVKKAQQGVDLAMQKLNFAMIERKTHEKLKEKAFEEYIKEFNEEEKKEIDELVSFQHATKKSI